jgi:hypothetical protein
LDRSSDSPHTIGMSEMLVTVDGIRGTAKLVIDSPNDKKTFKFRWVVFEDGSTGFASNVFTSPAGVTEVAAELMLRIIISNIANVLDIKREQIKIYNHLGVEIEDVEFMPPSFDGKEADIQKFVALQDSLNNLYSSYEESQMLTPELLHACEESGVLEDFLCLVQFQLQKSLITLSNGDSNG